MKKFLILIVLFILLACLAIGLFVSVKESKKLSGLEIEKVSETESRATLGNNEYAILFVPKEQIKPFFGLAKNEFGTKMALIKEGLPNAVQEFVIKHEIYHLQDIDHKGFLSRELYANLAAARYEPVGFFKTSWLTLTDIERVKYYLSSVL